jgi:phytoene dehydrogenase-like protein
MANAARERGVEIETDAPAREVIVEKGRAICIVSSAFCCRDRTGPWSGKALRVIPI